jgi:hypothetical protein
VWRVHPPTPQPIAKPAPATPPSTTAKPAQTSVQATIIKPSQIEAAQQVPPKIAPTKSEAEKTTSTKPDLPKPALPKPEAPKPAIVAAPAPAPVLTENTTPTHETIAVALNELPMSIHDQWTLNRDEARCTLQSAIQRMDDGQGGTKVSLWLTANEMSFLTESDIDLSYTGTGIAIGDRHFDLETVERRTNPAFSRQRRALLDAMMSGHTLELTLGFWPTWPVTHTYSVSFPLQHFASAYAALETCNAQLSQR